MGTMPGRAGLFPARRVLYSGEPVQDAIQKAWVLLDLLWTRDLGFFVRGRKFHIAAGQQIFGLIQEVIYGRAPWST